MKKSISFPVRTLSMMLALFLVMATTAIGIPTVAAKDHAKGERVYFLSLIKGDKLEKGVTLTNINEYNRKDYKAFSVYIDDELYQESEDEITIDRMVKVQKKSFDPDRPRHPVVYLETIEDESKRVYIRNATKGKFLEEGTTLVNYDPYWQKKDSEYFVVYIDDELYKKETDKVTIDRPTIVAKRDFGVEKGRFLIYPIIYLETLEDENEVNTQEALKLALHNGTTDLTDNIELTEEMVIDDGKAHVLNTNGYSLSQKNEGPTVIKVTDGSILTITGTGKEGTSTLSGGRHNEFGGAIRVLNDSKLVMSGMNISDNRAQYGGGIRVEKSTVELTNCKFKNNIADKNGGALYIDEKSTATLTECEITGNQAHDGAGIANSGTLTLKNSKIKSNTIVDNGGGGGIWSNGEATLTKTEITQNSGAVNGGGVTNHKNMTLTDCTVSANKATNRGGGMYIDANGCTTALNNCTLSDNVGKVGAGVNLYRGDLTVNKATMNNNIADEAGGAMWANSGTTAAFTDADMSNNSCKTNGGCLNSHGTLSLSSCTINGCSSENSGGGIYMDSSGTLTLQSSEITNCMSVSGAGINFYAGSLILMGGKTRVTDCTANGNSSNICFREMAPIQVKGRFPSGSTIGITPPDNAENRDITSGFGEFNEGAPADIFYCDNNKFKINRDEGVKEVNLIKTMQTANNSSYKIQIYIEVTDDADDWDYAYFDIYGRSDKGVGSETLLNSSGYFHESIDHNGGSYTYDYDCGSDNFPTSVDFITSFGTTALPRDFEGDVTIKINGVNVASRHVVHEVYGDERKNTRIDIGGDKYPYPDPDAFEVDMPKSIDITGVITVAAVDQYGMTWTAKGENITMENVSFPGEDTIESVDNSGFKWKVTSNHMSNHHSTYKMTFKSGSDVYPTITKAINVKFVFKLHLNVIVDGEKVYETSSHANTTVSFENIKAPAGYYIDDFDMEGHGIINDVSDDAANKDKYTNKYEFTFINDSVTLTAKLLPNNYFLKFEKNGSVEVNPKTGKVKKDKDVKGTVTSKTLYYDLEFQLPNTNLSRKNYTFVGWNTQQDGMGTMYAKDASVVNLTSKKGDTVTLYAIWKPENSASTTSSIFSDGTALIYVGAGILLASIAAAVIYAKKKKKEEGKEQTADEA